MCKIKNLSVKNYRGIHSLTMPELRRMNILLGTNNSSKSSVLEAIYILMNADKPSIPVKTNLDRDYAGLSNTDFEAFFHNFNTDEKILVNSTLESEVRLKLTIEYKTVQVKEFQPESIQASTLPKSYGLEYHLQKNDTQSHTTSIMWDAQNEKLKVSNNWSNDNRYAYFLAPRYNFNDFISHFNQIVTDKEKTYVLEALQTIEPRITDITVVGNHVMVDVGLSKLIPINLMGDGTRKLFTIVTAMYNAKNGIILIDEIDNGLYYKSMKSLWKAVLVMAEKFDIQVFASTHSLDSLNALNALLEEGDKKEQDEVNILTLRKYDGDDITTYSYHYEDFNYLLNREEELR